MTSEGSYLYFYSFDYVENSVALYPNYYKQFGSFVDHVAYSSVITSTMDAIYIAGSIGN